MGNPAITENTALTRLIIHRIGNRQEGEPLEESQTLFQPDPALTALLTRYFLSSLKGEAFHTFHTEIPDGAVKMADIMENLFLHPAGFVENSLKLACHLYEQSDHPKIKPGELYVAYFENCRINGADTDAIGLFKTEGKDPFLKTRKVENRYEVFTEEGTSLQRVDKGCLVYNQKREEGYIVDIVDYSGKGGEALYWKSDFLQLRPLQDEYFNTNHYLSLCKSFITEELPEQYEISKSDQIALLNRSAGYFKENENFDLEHFEKKVIGNPEIIQEFNQFKEDYQQAQEIVLENQFAISNPAVKKQNRFFRSVIKLDKNFHIYVHGNQNLMEQGVDEKGRKFYKIYYNEEN